MDLILRELYWFSKDSSIFALPYLRKLRSLILKKSLKSKHYIKVGSRVAVLAVHRNGNSLFEAGSGLELGTSSYIDYTGGISIGKNVTISEGARIYTHDHVIDGNINWRLNKIDSCQLIIRDFVWIGSNAIILNSVDYIDTGAVIAAGSVVTKNVDSYQVVAGNPAKLIRKRNVD